jgi:hypothetical protein
MHLFGEATVRLLTNSEGSAMVISNANNEWLLLLDLLLCLYPLHHKRCEGKLNPATAAQVILINLKLQCLLVVSLPT